MIEIFSNVMLALFGVVLTPFMAGLVDLFCEDKKVTLKNIYSHRKFVPTMAVITPVILLALFGRFGLTLQFGVYAFLAIILIMDAFADIKAQIIPNGLNFVGFLVGAVYIYYTTINDSMAGVDLLLGMLAGGGIFMAIAVFSYLFYKREGMGMGDVKLMAVLGMFFGWRNTIQIFVLSFFIGAIGSIFLMVTRIKKGNDYMAFGPYIVISAITTMFLSHQVMIPYWWKFIESLSNIFTIA